MTVTDLCVQRQLFSDAPASVQLQVNTILAEHSSLQEQRIALALLYAQWTLDHPLLSLPVLVDQLLTNLDKERRLQEMLCGHTWLAKELPFCALHHMLYFLTTLLLPSDRFVNPFGVDLVKKILQQPQIQLFISESSLERIVRILDQLAPVLAELVDIRVKPHPFFAQLLQDYLRLPTLTLANIHQAILLSFFHAIPHAPLLDALFRHSTKKLYTYLLKAIMGPHPTPTEQEPIFSQFFDPEKALFLPCFQEIFRYLSIPLVPTFHSRQPMMLSDILALSLARLVDKPPLMLKRVMRCYAAMKNPPLLQWLKFQLQEGDLMKMLSEYFNIECDTISCHLKEPKYLIEELEKLPKREWLMLRTPKRLVLITQPLPHSKQLRFLRREGAHFLRQSINTLTMSHILLRLCENQSSYNKKIKFLLQQFPLTCKQFKDLTLKEIEKEEQAIALEIIDQEFSKIFFNEELGFKFLAEMKLNLTQSEELELLHKLMLAVGSAFEYPQHLAHIIRKILISNEYETPSEKRLIHALCRAADQPLPLFLGNINQSLGGEQDEELLMAFHFALQRPEFYLLSNRHRRHLPLEEFNEIQFIIPK